MLVLVVGLVPAEETGMMPGLDGVRRHAELRGDLVESVRIPSHSVHPFRSNPYTDSDVFVHPLRRNS